MTRNEVLNSTAKFTKLFQGKYFLELDSGVCALWSGWKDPDQGGDGTLVYTSMNYKQYVSACFDRSFVGRDKRRHIIRDYCGSDVVLLGFVCVTI